MPDQRWVYPYVEDPHSSGVYEPDDLVLRPALGDVEVFDQRFGLT